MQRVALAMMYIAIHLLLWPETGASRITGDRRRKLVSDKCAAAVPGAEGTRRRKNPCTCAQGEVLHGPPPECWGVLNGARFADDKVSGKQCQCVSQAIAENDRETFADWSWSARARQTCRSGNSKVVYWTRHAEGLHQCPHRTACLKTRDPGLTAGGRLQAQALLRAPTIVAALDNVEERAQLVVASPLVRTMETAIIGFSDVLKDANWLLDADLQEFPAWGGKLACNAANTTAGRSLLTQYQRDDLIQQYDHLDPTWTDRGSERFKDGRESYRFSSFTERLAKREESRIVVVSHGNVIEDGLGWKSENAQVRVYSLCDNQWSYLGAEAEGSEGDEWEKCVLDTDSQN